MSFHARFFSVLVLVFLFILTPAYAAEENLTSPDIQETTADNGTEKLQEEQKIQALTGPVILDISVQGNVEVVTEHIMSIITSKVGEPVDEEKLRKDAEAIFELGFFVATDYRVTDKADGVDVVFLVQENPVVSKINFEGNTIYSSEKLEEMIFTKPGMIFNRTFFRNDLQRIKEKYQADGYVMANVADVRIEGT
ncbi:MAG: POTRA domain-containing protein, partial [Synergistaceae bacterium]|nr:POTRA domain-containing protein [Synergistaceae bacterium]